MVDLRADGASLARRRPAVNGRRPCTGPSRSAILSGPMPLPGEDWVACPRCRTALVRVVRSEEHTSELQSLRHLVCRLLLEKKNQNRIQYNIILIRQHETAVLSITVTLIKDAPDTA